MRGGAACGALALTALRGMRERVAVSLARFLFLSLFLPRERIRSATSANYATCAATSQKLRNFCEARLLRSGFAEVARERGAACGAGRGGVRRRARCACCAALVRRAACVRFWSSCARRACGGKAAGSSGAAVVRRVPRLCGACGACGAACGASEGVCAARSALQRTKPWNTQSILKVHLTNLAACGMRAACVPRAFGVREPQERSRRGSA